MNNGGRTASGFSKPQAKQNDFARNSENKSPRPLMEDHASASNFCEMPALEPLECHDHVSHINIDKNAGFLEADVSLYDKFDTLHKLVVSHFPFGLSEAQILAIFEEFNPVMCRIMINAPTPVYLNASCACVYFLSEKQCVAAVQRLNETVYKNCILEVKRVSSLF